MRRGALLTLLLATAPSCSAQYRAVSGDSDAGRPNIVLLLTDDQRYDTLSATGNPYIETPNLDRLTREGTLYTNAFVPSALCCPSRASLLTGRYPHETGVYNNQPEVAFPGESEIFPELLRAAGYETAFIGKWHIPNPDAAPIRGFDHWVSFEGQGVYRDQVLNVDGERIESNGFSADVLTEYAARWIARPREKPFFLMLSLKNCHKPYDEIPERFSAQLADAELQLPASAYDPIEELPPHIRRRAEKENERRAKFLSGEILEELRGYLALVLSVDESAGLLFGALERADVLDETLFAFTSDHGFLWGEHGLFQKRLAYDPSIRVPLAIRYPPQVAAGEVEERLVLSLDLAPTLLAAAGTNVPESLRGSNLMTLAEPDTPWRTSTLHYEAFQPRFDMPGEFAVRTADWKYLLSTGQDSGKALYNLGTDAEERTDLSQDESHRSTVERLEAELTALLTRADAPPAWRRAVSGATGK